MPKEIVIIPLDNRPVSLHFPTQLAKMSGIEVKIAPNNLAGEDLYDWIYWNTTNLQEVIVSIDGLGYGGLLESRTLNLSEYDVLVRLNAIAGLRGRPYFDGVKITAFNSILRLAPNVLSSSDLSLYDNIREWAIKKDMYTFDTSNTELYQRIQYLESQIGATALQRYKDTRARNLEINKQMLSWVSYGYIDELILPQDDANKYGLHRQDREDLKREVDRLDITSQVSIYPGVDETTSVLVARAVNRMFGLTPKFYIDYQNPTADKEWIAEFEDIGLDQNIRLHVQSMGATVVDSISQADLVIYPVTPYTNHTSMVDKIKAGTKPKVVLPFGAKHEFVNMLRKNVDVSQLHAYSGWNTVGNAIGIGIAQGSIRFGALQKASTLSYADRVTGTTAHVEFLLQRFYEDDLYGHVRGRRVDAYVRQIGGDFLNLGEKTLQVENYLDKTLRPRLVAMFYRGFANKLISTGAEQLRIEKSVIPRITLPWNRLFEVAIYPKVGLSTSLSPSYTYLDVTPESQPYAYGSIWSLTKYNVFEGGGNGYFYPNNNVLRGHVAKMLCNLFQLDTKNTPNPGFTDVPTSHSMFSYIAAVKRAGIMNGTSATTFEPDGELNRASVAKLLADAFCFMELADGRIVPTYFNDAASVGWATTHINILGEVGVASIPAEKLFYPNGIVTRAQIATFLDRIINVLYDYGLNNKL